jgi:hypothetical protein
MMLVAGALARPGNLIACFQKKDWVQEHALAPTEKRKISPGNMHYVEIVPLGVSSLEPYL